MRQDRRENGDYQRAVGEMVGREVIHCVSSLVWEIGRAKPDQWMHLFQQENWEAPAREAVGAFTGDQLRGFIERQDCPVEGESGEDLLRACLRHLEAGDGWRDFCEENGLEPHRDDIYEHWIVSEWLAARLEERAELIERDFYGLTIWGRACTGQAILLDGVICSIYDEPHPPDASATVAELNDRFRAGLRSPDTREILGRIVIAEGLRALSDCTRLAIFEWVCSFSTFTEDNDPHGGHDFGSFAIEGVSEKIFWKIDCYEDACCHYGAADPSDPAQSFRVLTVMLASER